MTMQGLMGSIDNQYVSQVRSMAQQATDAAYAFYHRPQYDYPDQGAYLTMVARIFINIIMLDGWGLWGIKVHLFLRI